MNDGLSLFCNVTFITFLILFIFSSIIRSLFSDKKYSTASAGSIVMAVGIFNIAVLPKLPFVTVSINHVFLLELFIIWLYIAYSYLKSYFTTRGLTLVFPHSKDKFYIGTWVAGCAVLATIIKNEFPDWYIVITIVSSLAMLIWLIYIPIVSIYFSKYILERKHISATGIMLLPTVGTQSIVILICTLLSEYIDKIIYQSLIVIGCLFYFLGLVAIFEYCVKFSNRRFAIRWSNTNCIIHGALSITGVACLITHAFSDTFIIVLWVSSTFLFAFAESISILKLYQRIKMTGLSGKAIRYDISQWTRLFTYGMYFSLTTGINETGIVSNVITHNVSQFGKYII